MKKLIYLFYVMLLLTFSLRSQAQSPCDCLTGCTTTISTLVTERIHVKSNQTLCITGTGVLKGNLIIDNNGHVCNKGQIICDSIEMGQSASLCNDGYIDLMNFHSGMFIDFINNGTLIIKNDIGPFKMEYWKNYGCQHFKGNILGEGIGQPGIFSGRTFIDGDFIMGIGQFGDLSVVGYLEIQGKLIVQGAANLYIKPGSCVKAESVQLKGGAITGTGPGFGKLTLTEGITFTYGGGGLRGMLDICSKIQPGPYTGVPTDPTVTYCVNNKFFCDTTRCDAVTCAISASAVPTQLTCDPGSNGQITATATGGTGPYTYSWSNGQTTATITGIASGTYTVTVISADGACSNHAVATVNPAPVCACTIDATAIVTHPYCPDEPFGTISVTPVGGVPAYIYQWSHGKTTATVTELRSGTYTVTVSDAEGRCVITKSYFINPAAISPLLVQGHDTLYAYPKQIGITYLYQWFRNGNLIAGASLDYYVATLPGVYSVLVSTDLTSESACTGSSNEISIYSTGVVNKNEDAFHVNIVPNPNNGAFSIYFKVEKKSTVDVEIYDIMGKQIVKTQRTIHIHDKMDMDISGYAHGLYFLEVKDQQGNRNVLKIISH